MSYPHYFELEVSKRTQVLSEALMRHNAGRLENPQNLRYLSNGSGRIFASDPQV